MDEIRQTPIEPAQIIETYESLASLIELTLLAPGLSADDLDRGCQLAREYGLAAVVVRPCDVEMVSRWMSGSSVKGRERRRVPLRYSHNRGQAI